MAAEATPSSAPRRPRPRGRRRRGRPCRRRAWRPAARRTRDGRRGGHRRGRIPTPGDGHRWRGSYPKRADPGSADTSAVAIHRQTHRLATLRSLRNIRAAVVGTGFIGLVHVEALRRLGIDVTGIVGSSQERAAAKAAAHNLPEPYASFEAMLADDRVDVVHLATPNHLHDGQVRAALAAGKHVVCEKPLAMTSAQTTELLALAQASGLVHAVNFNQRFYPKNLHAREFIEQGDLGDVRLITGGYVQDWLMYDTDWSWRLEREEGGDLRVIGDIGSHWLDLTSHLTGQRVDAVMADLTTFMPVRKEPIGHVETFSTATSQETRDR